MAHFCLLTLSPAFQSSLMSPSLSLLFPSLPFNFPLIVCQIFDEMA